MTSTLHTAWSPHAWSVIAMLRMLLAVLGLVIAGAAVLPLLFAVHGGWHHLDAALVTATRMLP
jgi:hypothetical protein